MLYNYPQYPTTSTYAHSAGALQCPPGTRPQPMYPGRLNSPVRCLVTNAMQHAEWVVTDTEPVPTDDIGPISGFGADKPTAQQQRSSSLITFLLLLGLGSVLATVAFGRSR